MAVTRAYLLCGPHQGYLCKRTTKWDTRVCTAVCHRLQDLFWWPILGKDIAWYIQTCHECQVVCMDVYHPPLIVQAPPTLFRKAYIDTMLMHKSKGFNYSVPAVLETNLWFLRLRPSHESFLCSDLTKSLI
jgi:hypothetical protein